MSLPAAAEEEGEEDKKKNIVLTEVTGNYLRLIYSGFLQCERCFLCCRISLPSDMFHPKYFALHVSSYIMYSCFLQCER